MNRFGLISWTWTQTRLYSSRLTNHLKSTRSSLNHPNLFSKAKLIRSDEPASTSTWLSSHTRRFLLITLDLGLVLYLFSHFLCFPRPVSGPSMLPTMDVNGDWILVSFLHRRGRWVKVGDIVSFEMPMRPGHRSMKRVIGMPGDFVLRDTPGEGQGTMLQVPQGHCWVAGDNLYWSRDSRHFGPLPLALIRGKALARVLPLKKVKWLDRGFIDIIDD